MILFGWKHSGTSSLTFTKAHHWGEIKMFLASFFRGPPAIYLHTGDWSALKVNHDPSPKSPKDIFTNSVGSWVNMLCEQSQNIPSWLCFLLTFTLLGLIYAALQTNEKSYPYLSSFRKKNPFMQLGPVAGNTFWEGDGSTDDTSFRS